MAYNPALPVGPFASRRRIRRDRFLTGSKVKVTNPKALPHNTARRTPTLGMGGYQRNSD